MDSQRKDFYAEAHLLVAAIRVHEHLHSQPATLEDICRMLAFSVEHAGIISRRLEDLGIIEAVQGSFGTRLFVRDHCKLEDIPRVYNGLGVAILSTPRGVISDSEAREAHVGGEILCKVL